MYDDVHSIAGRFSSASFDGMTDSTTYGGYEEDGKRIIGADYVHCERDLTPDYRESLKQRALEMYDVPDARHLQWFMIEKAESDLLHRTEEAQ